MVLVVNPISKEPIKGKFYLAFDTAWFTAYYSNKGIWIYGNKEITPTHWMNLPPNPPIK